MKNTPLPSIKISDATFQKLQHAAKLNPHLQTADLRRACLRIGLDLLEKSGYDLEGFMSAKAIESAGHESKKTVENAETMKTAAIGFHHPQGPGPKPNTRLRGSLKANASNTRQG